jgi:FMN phosphatase YigB (HAD superfamily)
MLAELDMEPHQVVMVGDNYAHDIEAAACLGMDTIWINARQEHVAGRGVACAVVNHVLDLQQLLVP